MASLPPIFSFTPSRTRVYATSAKGAGGSKEEKGVLDFVLGLLTKADEQFYETDPLFKKTEDKNVGGTTVTTSGRKNSVSIPQKKKENGGGFGGFGGLFAKK